jgi:hypothetical protein
VQTVQQEGMQGLQGMQELQEGLQGLQGGLHSELIWFLLPELHQNLT